MNSCEVCDLWKSINPEMGECRRNAPMIRNFEDGKGTPFWPYTSKTDGCGDFEPKLYINQGNEDLS